MEKFVELIGSRKFWAALFGVLLMVVKAYNPDFPLGEEQLTEVTYILVAYIVGTALESKKQ